MIELKNVTKRFGERNVVRDVSFTVNRGEIVGFLGPNGAGKTTTMRMITGFFPASEGSVTVAGFDISKEPLKAKEKIGYMPENVPLYRDMTVSEYLEFVAAAKGMKKADIPGALKRSLDESGTYDVKDKVIAKLSKGYRQRVGIAQAIINDPEVLILDEPTSGLDPKQIREIRTLIKNMKGDRTIILSTHILPEVSMTCDKVIVINQGEIIAQDRVADLEKTFSKGIRVKVETNAPEGEFTAAVKKMPGVAEVKADESAENTFDIDLHEGDDMRPEIARLIVKNKWELYTMSRQALSLEDVFLKLVTKEGE